VLDHDLGDDHPAYIAMEFLDGEDLGSRLHRVGRMDADATYAVVSQVARGLSRASSRAGSTRGFPLPRQALIAALVATLASALGTINRGPPRQPRGPPDCGARDPATRVRAARASRGDQNGAPPRRHQLRTPTRRVASVPPRSAGARAERGRAGDRSAAQCRSASPKRG
jgi:hypothetical protein